MKKPKLFMAFNGDATGLRDCLIEHFKREYNSMENTTGSTWADGTISGKRSAYFDIVHFLKNLTINENEHTDDEVQQ